MSIKESIKNIEHDGKMKIINKLNDDFDINYSVTQININSMEEFVEQLYTPFMRGYKIYYRGERLNSTSRKLLPTFLRNNEIASIYDENPIVHLNCDSLKRFYESKKQFVSVYETVYNSAEKQNLYNMLAFAQHYLGVSPFIDFTKSLYVALSFAIKGREKIDDDIVIYTAYDIDSDDTSQDVEEVISWLENYNVKVLDLEYREKLHKSLKTASRYKPKLSALKEQKIKLNMLNSIVDSVSPVAKLIDIPTNDLMKYQQGVFLLLNDFSLVDSNYLTKTVRQSFVINKYIISPQVASSLRNFLLENAPQYRYDCLLNISMAVKEFDK